MSSNSDNINLISAFAEFKELKNIDREVLMRILMDVFRHAIIKKFGSDDNFDIIVNPDKGDVEIFRWRTIVEDGQVQDPNKEIAYSEALRIEPDFEIGEQLSEEIKLTDFGRREILTIRQNLNSKVQEFEKDSIYRKYKDRVGEIVTGEVHQVFKKEILVLDDEGIELILPRSEQIPTDHYRKGDSIRAVILKVTMVNNKPEIIISRTAPEFLEQLLTLEVPEIYDGLITIRKIVRAPGERAKVAVESYDDRIDPVGACVGMKGSRIHSIVRELRNENIDVIPWSNNPELFIKRALNPAKVSFIKIDEAQKRAEVYMKPDQVALAIGKGGHNIKLAGMLTGYEIDVYRDTDEEYIDDVDLQEFSDEIDQWIIDILKSVGLDTARSVLNLSVEELMKRTDLEEETIHEIRRILQAEFE
ncbi:MAG: transcription termination factor NusA [Bacteroidales bacterium]